MTALPATAHTSACLEPPRVYAVQGYPGRYAIHFGGYFDMHITAEQWAEYVASIDAQLAALARSQAS